MSVCSRAGWCEGMTEALRGVPENHEGKGLSVMRGWKTDLVTGATVSGYYPPILLGVVYRKSRRHEGIVLNLCPWCGASVRFGDEDTGTKNVETPTDIGVRTRPLSKEAERVLSRLRRAPNGTASIGCLGTNYATARALLREGLVRSSTGIVFSRKRETTLSLVERP